jgi:hypothetical protein
MTLVITPVQVNLLGIEAYGLLGFTTLQLLFHRLDFGLPSRLTWELAADHSPDSEQSQSKVHSCRSDQPQHGTPLNVLTLHCFIERPGAVFGAR